MSEKALRCTVTGNPVGTDTRPVGHPCECANCRLRDRIVAAIWTAPSLDENGYVAEKSAIISAVRLALQGADHV